MAPSSSKTLCSFVVICTWVKTLLPSKWVIFLCLVNTVTYLSSTTALKCLQSMDSLKDSSWWILIPLWSPMLLLYLLLFKKTRMETWHFLQLLWSLCGHSCTSLQTDLDFVVNVLSFFPAYSPSCLQALLTPLFLASPALSQSLPFSFREKHCIYQPHHRCL